MEVLKATLAAALAAPGPPPPGAPPPAPLYVVEENVPDVLAFVGFIVYLVSLFFGVTDVMESEMRWSSFDYTLCPVYMLLGLVFGVASYAASFFAQRELWSAEHALLTTATFFSFAKHLTKSADMPNRRASAIIMLGSLPLLCLSVLDAWRVRVRSSRLCFALFITLAVMPLPFLFREWMPGGGRTKKRLFVLFFFSSLFVTLSTPRRLQDRAMEQGLVTVFDLSLVYYGLDGLWGPA